MDNSWRPNICPTCSNPHFPFCPPPFHHQYFPTNHHFTPPPPPQQQYNPYPPPPPPQYQLTTSNVNRNYEFTPNPIPLPQPFLSDNKRIRFHDSVIVPDDDQRRLRLIRDHGINNSNNNTLLESNSYRFFPNDNSNNRDSLKRKFEESSIGYHHNYNNVGLVGGERRIEVRNVNAGFSVSQQQHVPEVKRPVFGLSKQNVNVGLGGQPPLPSSPPPPLPAEMPGFRFGGPVGSSYSVVSQVNTAVSVNYSSSSSYNEEVRGVKTTSSSPNGGTGGFLMRNPSHPLVDKPKVIDASLILKHPHRSSRPDHVVVILRGLPGSGKSYLAKFLRDLEVENGGKAPRIHSMDDYFMTEVEKVEESESSGSARGKKPVAKKVMEYCYEPEMEEAYRSSMLKAFKKTLDEGVFSFVIVDDRNLRVADFAQFWATAKRSGYEVYVLEATYTDPAGCAARNVHSFTLTDIQKMANQWEETPSLYMKLDIKSVLHGDDLEENGIEEVDMDTEDDQIGGLSRSEDANFDKDTSPSQGDDGVSNVENKWKGVEEHPGEAVKELGKSKWSTDLDEDNIQKTEVITRKSSGQSALTKSNAKKGKPVRWADQVGKIGFSIGAGTATNVSLVIGPGFGYNLRSNPLPDEEKLPKRSGEPRRRNIFQEQLRAERESFKAVFDKRKQRINGLHLDDE